MALNQLSDLVRDSKLETKFHHQHTEHFVKRTTIPGRRPILRSEYWTRQKRLGKGAYGDVYLECCEDNKESHQLRAVKKISKPAEGSARNRYHRELEAIAKFSQEKFSGCFVKSHGWFEDETHVFIAMEYIQLGDLRQYMKIGLVEGDCQAIALQLLEGLRWMHLDHFAHRDLKPANILVQEQGPSWWVKIADFGISKRAVEGGTSFHSAIGTPGYLAPEVLGLLDIEGDEYTGQYTCAVDIWSLGEICFQALCGRPTFNSLALLGAYARGKLQLPSEVLNECNVSHEGREFIHKLMVIQPDERLSAQAALAEKWICDPEMVMLDPDATVHGDKQHAISEHDAVSEGQPLLNDHTTGSEASARWSTIKSQGKSVIEQPRIIAGHTAYPTSATAVTENMLDNQGLLMSLATSGYSAGRTFLEAAIKLTSLPDMSTLDLDQT